MSKPARFALPPALDTGGAAELARRLCELRGRPLRLDASAVQKVGALGLQVLASARLTWASDGEALVVEQASPALCAAFVQAGLPADFARSV